MLTVEVDVVVDVVDVDVADVIHVVDVGPRAVLM